MCLITQSCPLFENPWTIVCHTPLSMGFSRQEYLSGLPLPPAGNLPDPRIEPMSPVLAGEFFTTELPGKPQATFNPFPSLSSPAPFPWTSRWLSLFVFSLHLIPTDSLPAAILSAVCFLNLSALVFPTVLLEGAAWQRPDNQS